MLRFVFVMALLILAEPVCAPTVKNREGPHEAVGQKCLAWCRHQCERAEILDRQEVWYFREISHLLSDWKIMWQRQSELENAPALADAERLPSREVLWDLLQFNRRCQKNLQESLWPAWGTEELNEYLQELRRIERVYEKLLEAKSEYYFVVTRRAALKCLRDELLGMENYYSRCLPGPVPVEYLAIAE